jgi:hypothetical protein
VIAFIILEVRLLLRGLQVFFEVDFVDVNLTKLFHVLEHLVDKFD